MVAIHKIQIGLNGIDVASNLQILYMMVYLIHRRISNIPKFVFANYLISTIETNIMRFCEERSLDICFILYTVQN